MAVCARPGFALFSSPIMRSAIASVDRRYSGVASATIAATRMTGETVSMASAALLPSVFVGRHKIEPAYNPDLLTSVRVTFAILLGLCALGVAASLVGPTKTAPQSTGSPETTKPLSGLGNDLFCHTSSSIVVNRS
jgi:hypothetical protein